MIKPSSAEAGPLKPSKRARHSGPLTDHEDEAIGRPARTTIRAARREEGAANAAVNQTSRRHDRGATVRKNTNSIKRVDIVKSERTKRAWETRRQAKARTNAEDAEGDYEYGDQAGSSDQKLQTPLPTTEFLLSLHKHASEFYTAHDLLFEHQSRSRKNPWGSKKRLMLIQDAQSHGHVHEHGHSASRLSDTASSSSRSRPHSRSKSKSQVYSEAQEEDEVDELDDDEEGESRVDGINMKRELVDEYGELIRYPSTSTCTGTGTGTGTNSPTKRDRSKGKYKKRDMYRAIEGEGLMALGILLQEQIIQSIHDAGYCKLDPSTSIHPLTYKDEQQARRRLSSAKEGRHQVRNAVDDEEEDEMDMESEEGQGSDGDREPVVT
uniref:Rrn9 domain-containing protein n=1 Tax=Kwoniella dejecticola CBS 10117 TaxID=1296121 RepID=A0A1A6AEF7_9TREE|nr:uncharacterized protein I303_00225 [Kwoniella dejecticola CBS 10117]OBR88408.1 hypothetical protein I303_00225 [Kwoniella dejecticola CBS 10117]